MSDSLFLTIDRLSYGPAGVGRLNGKVIFVPGAAPGETLEIVLDTEKKRYATGHIVAVVKPSPHRRVPPCPYVLRCGGCSWQHIAYDEQLRAKESLVREQLCRLGGLNDIPLLPILSSPQEWRYRHRVRLHVEKNRRVGFSRPRSHEVVEVDSCLIAGPDVEEHFRIVREWLSMLRTSVQEVEIAVGENLLPSARVQAVLIGEAQGPFQRTDDQVCARFLAAHPSVAGMLLRGGHWRRRWGDTSLMFTIGRETLAVRDGVFTQVNSMANHVLVESLVRLSGVRSEDRVLDFYCGAGNFSIPLARQALTVIGVEQDERGVVAAQENAMRAGVKNTRFLHAPVHRGVHDLLKQRLYAEVIVLDPPRTGAAEVIDELPRFGARTVAYVSCDPTTLARDLRRLQQHGYRLQSVQPIDMFPQTHHVETIAVSVLTC
jgi:23S rRNA (uracil1939-C5)-methyltransferase